MVDSNFVVGQQCATTRAARLERLDFTHPRDFATPARYLND